MLNVLDHTILNIIIKWTDIQVKDTYRVTHSSYKIIVKKL